jgi:hypothetical protein
MKNVLLVSLFLILNSFILQKDDRTANFPRIREPVEKVTRKNNVWVFIMAGQSNMAGRGLVEPQDTISDTRILTISSDGRLVYAKEPLHFYEPNLTGLDCGLSFGKTLLKNIPKNISILIIPTAVGGSSINQWLKDSTYRNVQLLSNFKEKVELGKKYGTIKAVLWHQGESDANATSIPLYENRLAALFSVFRKTVQNKSLPILVGELGSYSTTSEDWNSINRIINHYSLKDRNTAVVRTADFKDKGDHVHFDSDGQRQLGVRYAEAYLNYSGRVKY